MDGRHLEAITEDQIEWRHEVDAELVLELAEALREALGVLVKALAAYDAAVKGCGDGKCTPT
jgi:hypothetical protein